AAGRLHSRPIDPAPLRAVPSLTTADDPARNARSVRVDERRLSIDRARLSVCARNNRAASSRTPRRAKAMPQIPAAFTATTAATAATVSQPAGNDLALIANNRCEAYYEAAGLATP